MRPTRLVARVVHRDAAMNETLGVVQIHRQYGTDDAQSDITILVVSVLDLLLMIVPCGANLHGNQRVEHTENALVVTIQIGEDPDAIAEEVANEEDNEADHLQCEHCYQQHDRRVEYNVLQ